MIVRKHAIWGGLFSVLATGALLLLLAVSVSAQLPTGTFLGVVKDASGAVVPGATVTIHSTETESDAQGYDRYQWRFSRACSARRPLRHTRRARRIQDGQPRPA